MCLIQIITCYNALEFTLGTSFTRHHQGFPQKPHRISRRIFCPGWSEARRTSSEVCWNRARNGLQVRSMNGLLKHGQWDDGSCFWPSKMVMVDVDSIFVWANIDGWCLASNEYVRKTLKQMVLSSIDRFWATRNGDRILEKNRIEWA